MRHIVSTIGTLGPKDTRRSRPSGRRTQDQTTDVLSPPQDKRTLSHCPEGGDSTSVVWSCVFCPDRREGRDRRVSFGPSVPMVKTVCLMVEIGVVLLCRGHEFFCKDPLCHLN